MKTQKHAIWLTLDAPAPPGVDQPSALVLPAHIAALLDRVGGGCRVILEGGASFDVVEDAEQVRLEIEDAEWVVPAKVWLWD